MPTSLEIEDLKHRWSGCFVALPRTNEVGIFLDVDSPKAEKYFLNISGKEVWRDSSLVEFKVPTNQYVNVWHSKEYQGIYVYKTGARFYKKGFSLMSHGGNQSKMFDCVSPLNGKVRALNCVDEETMFFLPDVRLGISSKLITSFIITKSSSVHQTVAEKLLLQNDTFVEIESVLDLILNNKTVGLAISPQFFIGLSSNEDYDAELYCGLISVGFIRAKTKTIFVNGPIAQEVSDFLIQSGQTKYEIISV